MTTTIATLVLAAAISHFGYECRGEDDLARDTLSNAVQVRVEADLGFHGGGMPVNELSDAALAGLHYRAMKAIPWALKMADKRVGECYASWLDWAAYSAETEDSHRKELRIKGPTADYDPWPAAERQSQSMPKVP